jgi:hypothetical protein
MYQPFARVVGSESTTNLRSQELGARNPIKVAT